MKQGNDLPDHSVGQHVERKAPVGEVVVEAEEQVRMRAADHLPRELLNCGAMDDEAQAHLSAPGRGGR